MTSNLLRYPVVIALLSLVAWRCIDIQICYANLDVFSEGMQTPQTISQVPAGFGSIQGDYVVPDTGTALDGTYHIWLMSADDGAFTEFANLGTALPNSSGPRGGLFLPESFGDIGGRYLTAFMERDFADLNATPQRDILVRIVTVDSSGNVDDFVRFEYQGPIGTPFEESFPFFPFAITTPVLAPQDFGSLGGQVVFTDQCHRAFQNRPLACIVKTGRCDSCMFL